MWRRHLRFASTNDPGFVIPCLVIPEERKVLNLITSLTLAFKIVSFDRKIPERGKNYGNEMNHLNLGDDKGLFCLQRRQLDTKKKF